jgi:hypothetical protein
LGMGAFICFMRIAWPHRDRQLMRGPAWLKLAKIVQMQKRQFSFRLSKWN